MPCHHAATLHHAPRRAHGLTLIECATAVAVVAIALGAALPSFLQMRARQHLDGLGTQLETDLILARAEAVARNEPVRVAFARDARGSCYVLHSGAAGGCVCDGTGATVCAPGAEALRQVHLDARHPVQLVSNSASLLFDAVKGTVTPTATIRLDASAGTVHAIVNIMGRVRHCTPTPTLSGYPLC